MPTERGRRTRRQRPKAHRPQSASLGGARAQPRVIARTRTFKTDYKREAVGRHQRTLDADLRAVVARLVLDEPLERRHRDHALAGAWKDHRDCHVRPDLVLIYRKVGDELQLVRLGSHSELAL